MGHEPPLTVEQAADLCGVENARWFAQAWREGWGPEPVFNRRGRVAGYLKQAVFDWLSRQVDADLARSRRNEGSYVLEEIA